jgi:broad specificity phosphatase PhoE
VSRVPSGHSPQGVLLLVLVLCISACNSGYQGHVYERLPDGGIGPALARAELTFTREDGASTGTVRTNAAGFYRISLGDARYRVVGSHYAFDPYDSSPGFFVVSGSGYQTGNVFLTPISGTVVLLVRHAERASAAANSDLAADPGGAGIGVGRADTLGVLARDARVQAVYTTDFCRTAQTGQPAAVTLGLTMQIMASGSASAGLGACNPAITVATAPAAAGTSAGIAAHIAAHHAGQVVLVVGHSNTVPEIAAALGAALCPAVLPAAADGSCVIPDDEFNHLFVVRLPAGAGAASVTHERYGAP